MNELACYSRATAEQNIICSQLFIAPQRWGVFHVNNIFLTPFFCQLITITPFFCKDETYRPVLSVIVMHEENPVKIFLTMPKNKTNDVMLIKEMKVINN